MGVELEAPEGGVAVTVADSDGAERVVHARFVVDASGRDALLGVEARL